MYMIDCLDGPFPIMNYLCKAYQVQNTLIGNENLDANGDRLPESMQLFFTRESSFIREHETE